MATLLIAEYHGATLNDSTAKALTAAKALGAPVTILVAGNGVRGAADAAAKLDGVAKVLLAEGDAYAHALAEPLAALIVSWRQPMTPSWRRPDDGKNVAHRARPCST
jgi:electron transfer flavoprotein alpha subunit